MKSLILGLDFTICVTNVINYGLFWAEIGVFRRRIDPKNAWVFHVSPDPTGG